MNIKYRRKPENEEMIATYDFFKHHKNHIIAILAGIAVIIIAVNLYKSSHESNKLLAADKLFEVSKAFNNSDDETVISKGKEYIDKFSGFDSTGDIVILIAKSYIRQNNQSEAIKVLESNQRISGNETFKFSLYNLLGGLYMDKWLIEKKSELADKAGEFYLKAAYTDRELHRDRTLYNAGNCFAQAGKIDKAKSTLKPLYDNSRELEYKLREQVKYLYERLD
ncbi:MAG: tetratricopeptide repeat protein [Candidatus Delongbacteria bacterium]|nr:tetratricopeptide repeat protein [Candidatus Delongbacteria bacterium]